MVVSCVAFGCTNRFSKSNEGISFHRFPKNADRRKVWEKAVRRKEWSAKDTSFICSEHFEFKWFDKTGQTTRLRANAMPTIFHFAPKSLKKAKVKRKPPKERCGEPAQHKKSSDSQIDLPQIKESLCDPFHNSLSSSKLRQTTTVPKPTNGGLSKQLRASNVSEEAVLKHGQTTHTTKRKRGRPRGRPATKKVNAISRKSNPHISTRSALLRRKRKRNVSPQHISVLPKKLAKVSTGTMLNGKILKESDTSSDEEDNFVKTVIIKRENECFVCENQVSDGTPLETLTTTSRAPIRHKLDRIAAGARGHLDLSQDPGGVLCSHCTCVLNHLDQIEVELNLLTKSVLNALLKKYGLASPMNDEGDDENIEGTYLENVEYVENTINHSSEALATPKDHCIDQINNLNIKEELPSQEYHCRVCFYTCNKKSLLVFHLRDHLKRNCHRCDFCNLYIEEGELHNHGDKQHVKPYVTLDRKDSTNIQYCPNQVASETPKMLKVSENQANDTSLSKESSNERRSQNFHCGVLGGRPVKESKDSFNVGLDNDIVRKHVTFSELDYATDVSFVTLPRTRQPPYIITSTLSDLSEKHEREMLDYISSEMSSLIRTESDTIKSVLGDSEADYIDNKCTYEH